MYFRQRGVVLGKVLNVAQETTRLNSPNPKGKDTVDRKEPLDFRSCALAHGCVHASAVSW